MSGSQNNLLPRLEEFSGSRQAVVKQLSGSCQAVVRQSEKSSFFRFISKQTLPEWTKAKTPMRISEIRRSIFLGKNSGKLKENSGKLWTNSGIFFFRQITARNMASRRCKVLIPKEAVPRCTGLRTSFG